MLSSFSTNFHVLPNRQQAFDFLTMLTKLQFFYYSFMWIDAQLRCSSSSDTES